MTEGKAALPRISKQARRTSSSAVQLAGLQGARGRTPCPEVPATHFSDRLGTALPRITFGVIVINGEPFTRYCLRQLYPHAHQIIVVEGGSPKVAGFAPDGHSTDGTLDVLHAFKRDEDPEGKLQIVTKDGFWPEKDEQSQAYAELATGDYLWQVDIDEFYRHEDIETVRRMLAADPGIDAVSFLQFSFWGSPAIITDSFMLRSFRCHRLFKWGGGYSYATHRPPTVVDERGVNLRDKRWVKASEMARRGVYMFHYSLLLPVQVRMKSSYYATSTVTTLQGFAPRSQEWADNGYHHLRRPFRVHNVYTSISWLRRFRRPHPEEALRMWEDAQAGRLGVELRDNSDADRLLRNPFYVAAAAVLTVMATLLKYPPLRWGRRLYLAYAWRRDRRAALRAQA